MKGYSRRFTHISGHPSATGRAQDRESSPVKDRRSTTVPCNQPYTTCVADYVTIKDERLSQPGWLTYSGRFTHISIHPSAVGQAQDRESSPVVMDDFKISKLDRFRFDFLKKI